MYLERVADLTADVREGDVETGHEHRLQLTRRYDVWIDGVASEEVDEDDVCWTDKRRVLPGVLEQRPVHTTQPRRHLISAPPHLKINSAVTSETDTATRTIAGIERPPEQPPLTSSAVTRN